MTTINDVIKSCLFRTRFILEGKYKNAFIDTALAGNTDFHVIDPVRWVDINASRAASVHGYLSHVGEFSFSEWSRIENDEQGVDIFRLLLSAPNALRNKLRGYGEDISLYKRLDYNMRRILSKEVDVTMQLLNNFVEKMQKISDIAYDANYWANNYNGHVGFLHQITPFNALSDKGSYYQFTGNVNGIGIWSGTTVSNCIPVPIYASPTFAAEACVRSMYPFIKEHTFNASASFGQNVFYIIKFNPYETYNCAPLTTFGQPEILIPTGSEFKVTDISIGKIFNNEACLLVSLETQSKEVPSENYARWAWRDFVDGLPIPAIQGVS